MGFRGYDFAKLSGYREHAAKSSLSTSGYTLAVIKFYNKPCNDPKALSLSLYFLFFFCNLYPSFPVPDDFFFFDFLFIENPFSLPVYLWPNYQRSSYGRRWRAVPIITRLANIPPRFAERNVYRLRLNSPVKTKTVLGGRDIISTFFIVVDSNKTILIGLSETKVLLSEISIRTKTVHNNYNFWNDLILIPRVLTKNNKKNGEY